MNHILSLWLWLLLILCFPIGLFSQISYTATHHPQAGNPGGINTESDFMIVGWDTLMDGGLFQNQWSSVETIPFDFSFFGRDVHQFRASANGLLSFKSSLSTTPNQNEQLPSSNLPDSTIACFWEGFTDSPPTGTNDQVQTKLFGQAPNRQLWVRWHSYKWGPANFEFVAVVLEETTHNIYLVDMYGSLQSNMVTSSVGLQASNQFAVKYGNDQIPLSGATAHNADNSYYLFEPFPIEAYDMVVVDLVSPSQNGCNSGLEEISVRLSNVGLFAASGIQAKYSLDGAPFTSAETVPGTLLAGDSLTYTFVNKIDLSTPGVHQLKVVAEVAGDNNQSNDTLGTSVNALLTVSKFPYQENFEQGDGGWIMGGDNSSWELGYPNNTIMQGATSGVNAWVTNLRGSYQANEKSWVASPCFDLSKADADMRIAMKVWWETEFSWDGAVLQSSTDEGENWENVGDFGDPDNWYNDNTISALPGGSPIGWTGGTNSSNGSEGWVQVSHPIGVSLAHKDKVRFRIAFGSDNAQQDEGFAFDDVILATPPRVSLGPDGFYCEGTELHSGHPDKTVVWSTGATTPSISLNNLTGSIFADSMIVVSVTDGLGLTSHDTIMVSMTTPIAIEEAQLTDVLCAGDSSGMIALGIVGGASPYTYEWSNGVASEQIDGLAAGSYSVIVSDVNACEVDSVFVIQDETQGLSINVDIDHAACDGEATGSIQLEIMGGIAPYTYLWDTGDTTTSLHNLRAGIYQVLIEDSVGCTKEETIQIQESGDLQIQLNQLVDASCERSNDGMIDLSITGGTPPYFIDWDHGASGQQLTTLSIGTYTGTVSDSNGCQLSLPAYTLSYSDSLPIAGYDYIINGAGIGFSDSSQYASEWFWDFGDMKGTSTDANPTYFYQENGSYQVMQIATNACGSDTFMQTIVVQAVGIDLPHSLADISLFPNPVQERTHIRFGNVALSAVQIDVLSLDGSVLYTEHLGDIKAGVEFTFDWKKNMPNGIYLIRIQSEQGRLSYRIIKK